MRDLSDPGEAARSEEAIVKKGEPADALLPGEIDFTHGMP